MVNYWKTVKFDDVCAIVAPMVNPQDTQYWMLPHIGNENIEKHTGKLLKYHLVKDDNLISGKYYFTEDEVLYGKINPHFAKVAYPGFNGLCSADMYPIRCVKEVVPEFLKYVLLTENFTSYTTSVSMRSGMPKVNRNELAEYQFSLPSIPEQNRIAEALSDVDGMISSLEKLIAKKKAVKQGAMQELLTGKKRLLGFTGEWNTFVFGELFDFIPNNAFTRSQMSDSGNVKNIHYGDILTLFGLCIDGDNNSIPYINQDIDLTRFADRCYLQSGDVIIADTAEDETVGKALEIDNVNSPVLAGQHTLLCRPKIKFANKFLGYYLNATCYHDQLLPFIVGTKVSSVSKSSIAQTKLVVPDFEEQTAIASILSDMDKEIEALEQKLAKTRQIKQGMMQQLLTGKIRFTGKDEDIPRKRTLHSANIYFKRAVLAAEIASRLYQESTFGHVKMEKLLFLTEKLCDIDLNSNYHRDAAGPYDNRALRSIDSQLKKQKWFDVVTIDRARRYIPMEKSGTHSEYFKRYYNHILQTFNFIISTFQKMNTEQCEIVATLYSAWEDFLLDGCVPNDSMIVEEVLNNWHNSKKRISQERWESALNWMRQKNIIPKQRGSM